MASRTPLLLLSAVLLIPGSVFAQAPAPAPPAETDQALRARVTEFFQDFIDGKFRAAINLVAEDTQDYYFASPKAEIRAFKIDGIEYSDDFSKAVVTLTATKLWHLRAEGFSQDEVVPGPMDTTWKIENGKWVFYDKPQTEGYLTPMGKSDDVSKAPKDAAKADRKINDGTMAAEAQKILDSMGKGTGVKPSEVTFVVDKPGSAKVVFHNGVNGQVSIGVEGMPKDTPGLTYTVENRDVNAGGDGTIDLQFDPSAGKAQPTDLTVHVVVNPFSLDFPIKVHLQAQ